MATTTIHTQPLRDEHRELLPDIEALRTTADLVGTVSFERLWANLTEAEEFLTQHLVPHAIAEDEALYPAVEAAMGAPGATETMRRDHVEVVRLVGELTDLCAALAASPDADHGLDLRRVLYGLHAIVKLHFAKEEELYLPTLDGWLDEAKATELFERLEHAAAAAKAQAGA